MEARNLLSELNLLVQDGTGFGNANIGKMNC